MAEDVAQGPQCLLGTLSSGWLVREQWPVEGIIQHAQSGWSL